MITTEIFQLGINTTAVDAQPQNIYFLDYVITPNTDVKVYMKGIYNNIQITPEGVVYSNAKPQENTEWYEMEVVEFPNLPQQVNQVSIDYNKSLLIFNPQLFEFKNVIEFKVIYSTQGFPNYFKFNSNVFNLVSNIVSRSKFRILDGIYLTKEKCDKPFDFWVVGGSLIYNSEFYVVEPHLLRLNNYGVPTFKGGYRSYLLVVNDSVIRDKYNVNHNSLLGLGVFSSQFTYMEMQDAIDDVYAQLPTDTYNMIVALITFLYTQSGDYLYWIKYFSQYRKLELTF